MRIAVIQVATWEGGGGDAAVTGISWQLAVIRRRIPPRLFLGRARARRVARYMLPMTPHTQLTIQFWLPPNLSPRYP